MTFAPTSDMGTNVFHGSPHVSVVTSIWMVTLGQNTAVFLLLSHAQGLKMEMSLALKVKYCPYQSPVTTSVIMITKPACSTITYLVIILANLLKNVFQYWICAMEMISLAVGMYKNVIVT